MSTQETNLKAIADAIREKDGTTEPIPASAFPERIRAIPAGGLPDGIYTIDVQASDLAGGIVNGGGMASGGMTVTVEASMNEGYVFEGWKENEEVVSQDNPYTFLVDRNRAFIGGFAYLPYTAGVDWWGTEMPFSAKWRSVAYGNGRFVAIGAESNVSKKAAYSFDGITWIETNLPSYAYWYDVAYGDGKFVIIAEKSNKLAWSEDGINWIEGETPSTNGYRSIAYGNGKFVAVMGSSAIYSDDLIDWGTVTLPNSKLYYKVAYGNGKFIAIYGSTGNSTNKSVYSDDGINWVEVTMPSSLRWYNIVYGNGKFVATVENRGNAAYSEDGINWTEIIISSERFYGRSLAYGDGKFVVIDYNVNGSELAFYSEDGITWIDTTMPYADKWVCVAFGNGKFVATCDGLKSAYSSAAGPDV